MNQCCMGRLVFMVPLQVEVGWITVLIVLCDVAVVETWKVAWSYFFYE